MNQSKLILRLKQTVKRFYTQYHIAEKRKILAKFDRTLFSEDFQSLDFYVKELQQTLTVLEHLQSDQQAQYQFYSQKLLAQCNALADALTPSPRQSVTTTQAAQSLRARQKQLVHQLPPRKRLEKYYDALRALNEKLEQQQTNATRARNHAEKQYHLQQAEITKQRRARCLEAIELLEDYLSLNND
ncbi:primosomal replication protein PriC [Necropsobacter massiliensis]|uniref:primosomal replication protein PriC n=1 Tax=Necropsobacter massiliensis TaxID=1400001 RepID=UPI000595D41D|nr:primosomal replication protein PriC [Necropsobacter massiliensis]